MDGSEQSVQALEYALDSFPDAELTLLNVLSEAPSGALSEHLAEESRELREERRAMLREYRDPDRNVTIDVVDGRPARGIVAYAEEHDVDQVVIGSHGRDGVTRVLLGSVAERVARRAPCPVTIVR